MPLSHTDAIAKAIKLLKLAQSDNPHESALAAARAQDILTRYQIQAADLHTADTSPEEPITNTHEPLDGRLGVKLARWRTYLGSSVAQANQCRIYLQYGQIRIVGRATDAQTTSYLYGYLQREVDRLARQHASGHGATYANNYRLGIVDTLHTRLSAQRHATVEAMRQETYTAAGEEGLIRINHALMRVEAADREVEAWMRINLRLRAGSSSTTRADGNARADGRAAGHGIRLAGGARLSTGHASLNA